MKAEARLDPVRRRRPRRSTLARMLAVTGLLVVAALVAWSGSSGCDPPGLIAPADPNGAPAGDDSSAEPDGASADGDSSADPKGAPAGGDSSADPNGAPAAGDSSGGSRGASPDGGTSGPGGRVSDTDGAGSPATGSASGRTRVPPGSVGVPIRLAEPAALNLVHPGDRVDLFRVEETGGTTAIAAAAVVLSMTGADDPITGGIMVALRPPEAEKALSRSGRGFAVLLRPD